MDADTTDGLPSLKGTSADRRMQEKRIVDSGRADETNQHDEGCDDGCDCDKKPRKKQRLSQSEMRLRKEEKEKERDEMGASKDGEKEQEKRKQQSVASKFFWDRVCDWMPVGSANTLQQRPLALEISKTEKLQRAQKALRRSNHMIRRRS